MQQHDKLGAGMSRRSFMRATAAGAGVFAIGGRVAGAQDSRTLRVGLVGCGRRGTGAARDCVGSAPSVEIAAIGDLFPDAMKKCRKELAESLGRQFTATDDTCFSGWDAGMRVIASDVDLVILAAPPGFRPRHLAACVDAGRHVFMEKPVAVDPAGVRSVIDSAGRAEKKGLGIAAGTQRRHQTPYIEVVKRLHDGAIGDIVSAQCYWIGGYDYYTPVLPQAGWSDMERQIRNWNYFTWLSGDHIVEQHVHNIDVMNWVLRATPLKAIGLGGRAQRTGQEFGHIYDHFAVEFEYPGGVRVNSYCRQMKDCASRVAEYVTGTKGTADPRREITGPNAYVYDGEEMNPYVQEHADLIASIRAGEPINEGRAVAESTMAAVMGRLAAYTGQEVTWDFVMNESTLDLTPESYTFGPLPAPPVAIPGETALV